MNYLERAIKIVHYNMKIICNLNFIAAFVLAIITPVFFSLRMLSFSDMAVVGEYYLSIMGIILFSCIGDIEKRDKTEEIVYWRKTSHILIFAVRILMMMIFVLALILSITYLAKINSGEFPLWSMTGGIWISAVYLGMVGLTTANMAGDITSGYLIAFAYYGFELFTKGKYTMGIYLYSMTNNCFQEKYKLLLIIVILCIFNIIVVSKKSEG